MISDDAVVRMTGDTVAVRALTEQVAYYRRMVETVTDVIIRGNAQRRRTYVSPSVRGMLGYEPAELLYGGGLELVHPEDRPGAAIMFRTLGPTHPSLCLTFRMRRKDESYIWVEGRYSHLPEDDGVMAVLRDITDRKVAEDRLAAAHAELAAANATLQQLADQDGLTGLANRRAFDRRLDQELGRARREGTSLAVVLLDVDCFKLFNDRYGHVAGDECLRQVSGAVRGVLLRPSDFAARYGGEEIVVVLPATEGAGALHLAEAMCCAVAGLRIEHAGSQHGVVTISAGTGACIPTGGREQAAELIAAADRHLYAAKAAGRNTVRGAMERLG